MLASDVVMSVLVHMPDRELVGTPLEIHAAFRKVASNHEDLFSGFTFGRPGGPVSSYAVEVAWDNLATSGMLSTSNPRLVRHRLDQSAVEYFDKKLRREFDDAGFDETKLRSIAEEFVSALEDVRSTRKKEDLLVLT